MRVLHLDSGRGMRGGQWQAARLVAGLEAAGVECTLLARRGGALLDMARAKGWRARPLGRLPFERGYSLVHAHDAGSHTLAALLGLGPLVVSRRVAFGGPISGPFERWKYARAARYIAVSEHVKTVLAGRGVPPEKIAVVYDGVPLLDCPARDGATFRVVAVANLGDPQKGAALAVAAARRAGIEIELSTQLERDLERAAVFVYITRNEGLGSAVLLAMSAGVPVVASRTGGLTEIVRHGENGLLAENTPEAIASALATLAGDSALAARLGAAGRRTVMERFTVDAMVRRTMEVYRTVLS